MKYVTHTIFLVIINIFIISCSNNKLTVITIDNSSIEALFPKKPIKESKNVLFGNVGNMKASMASLEYKNIEYSVSYQVTESDTFTYTKEGLYPAYLTRLGAKTYEKEYITLNSIEGVQYKLHFNDRKAIVQMFADSNKTYNIFVIFPEKNLKDAEKFLKSIKIN